MCIWYSPPVQTPYYIPEGDFELYIFQAFLEELFAFSLEEMVSMLSGTNATIVFWWKTAACKHIQVLEISTFGKTRKKRLCKNSATSKELQGKGTRNKCHLPQRHSGQLRACLSLVFYGSKPYKVRYGPYRSSWNCGLVSVKHDKKWQSLQ